MDENRNIAQGQPEQPPPVDAAIEVRVLPNKMRATAMLTPPENGGNKLTAAQVKQALADKGVVFGLDEQNIARLAVNPSYTLEYELAMGVDPIPGEDATIEYRIRLSKDIKPHEREDGSVDFKDLGIVENVQKGQVLCVKTPPTAGVEGHDVLGGTIAPKMGRDMPLPMGRNTRLSEDGLSLLALTDGQADYTNRKVNVLETFTVEGDVSNATGDINFVGNVIIKGNVLAGFTVKAGGNINVSGSVEAANLISGGSIFIAEGINGMNKGMVQAEQDVKSRYFQACEVRAKGNVEAEVVLHSNIQCGGSLTLVGKSTMIGGHCLVRSDITAGVIGGKNTPIPTVIEIGIDPAVLSRKNEIPGEIADTAKEIANLDCIISLMMQYEAAGRLDQSKSDTLASARNTRLVAAERLLALQDEEAAAEEQIAQFGSGRVTARQSFYPGVRINIGGIQMNVSSSMPNTSIYRRDGELVTAPAT